jgi:hypothetical protein
VTGKLTVLLQCEDGIVASNLVRGVAAVVLAMALVGVPEMLRLPGCSVASAEDTPDSWRWSITPYAWGSTIKTDVSFSGGQEVGSTANFDDILDKLDFGAMLHFEGRRGAWGMFVDATYITLSDDTTQGPFSVSGELDTGLYEFAATWTPGGEQGAFTAFAGARIVDLSIDLKFSGPGPLGPIRRTSDKSYTDVMVGGRFIHPFNDRWLLELRGDIAGGDTESSWNGLALVGWKFGDDFDKAVLFGWRHMELEVEEGGRTTDVSFDGPIAGVLFSF